MKNLILVTIYSIHTLLIANQELPPEDHLVRMLKEDQIEKKLMSSEVFKSCALKYKNSADLDEQITKTSECIKLEVAGLDKSKAESLLKNLELGKVELYGDPNQRHLSEYLSTLVQKALYGDSYNKPNALNKVNQEMFTLVYERVVGKALFFELAHYCLEKNKSKKLKDDISIQSIVANMPPSEIEDILKKCKDSIKNSCDLNPKTNSIDDEKTQACLFNRRLVEFKSIMSELKEDKAIWQEIRANPQSSFSISSIDANLAKQRSLGEIAGDITNLSSSQIVDEGYKENIQFLSKKADEMEAKCKNNPDDQNCKEFFNRGIGESLGQYRLQKELELELKIKTLENSSLSQLKETAKKSNYFSTEQLENLQQASEEEIKKAIKDKYIAEKESIKADIDKRISSIGISKKKDLKEAGEKISNIHTLLKNRPDELRAINYFSNIVVATFTFKNDKEGKKRVFSGIDKEMQDLQKNKNKPESAEAIKYLQDLRVGGDGNGRTAASIEENHFLDADEIDHLLFD